MQRNTSSDAKTQRQRQSAKHHSGSDKLKNQR